MVLDQSTADCPTRRLLIAGGHVPGAEELGDSMASDAAVVRLEQADAVTLVRLLDAFASVLDSVELEDDLRDVLMGEAVVDLPDRDRWQQRLAAEVTAASGMLSQLLDGYDPSAAIAEASPSEGSPSIES